MESFSRQSGSKAEISVAKLTNAEKCTTSALLKWLLYLISFNSGKVFSGKCGLKIGK